MWAWSIGAFSLAAAVNQIAIALAGAHRPPPNPIFTSNGHPNCSVADEAEFDASPACTSQASFLIASRSFDTVMDSMTRGPAMRSAFSVWCDQTPL